jgi:hypothetical protein
LLLWKVNNENGTLDLRVPPDQIPTCARAASRELPSPSETY